MVAQKVPPAQTYCMKFHGSSMKEEGFSDDITFARDIAKHLGVKLTEVESDPNCMERLPDLVNTLEEPLADPAPLYVQDICATAKADGIKVLMSGTGGDDIFAGYRRHQAAMLRMKFGPLAQPIGWLANNLSSLTPSSTKRRLQKLSYMLQGNENDFLHRAFEFLPHQSAQCFLNKDASVKESSKYQNALKMALRSSGRQSTLNRLLFMELHGFLPDHNLTYTDKAAMNEGVEVRVPLIDIQLLDFAQNLPLNQKIKGRDTKYILKQAIQDRLPEGILNRPKAGFGAPIRQWLCHDKADMVEDIIFSQTSQQRGLFSHTEIRKLYNKTKAGTVDGAYTLLSLMMIELWCQQFVDMNNSAQKAA